jgi:hypothetical protein
LTVAETDQYIRKQFAAAKGRATKILAPGTSSTVYQYVGGVPRLINTLMDAVLSEASAQILRSVNSELIQKVAKDLGWRPLSRKPPEQSPNPTVQTNSAPAPDAGNRDKPPVLAIQPAKDDLSSGEDDNPDNVKTDRVIEQPLELQADKDESNQRTTIVSERSFDPDRDKKSGQDDKIEAGTMTTMLRTAAETLESDLETAPEPAGAKDKDAAIREFTGGVPAMNAEDTGATGMLKLEDLDARFAETVSGQDAGMVNALEELAKMRGLNDDSEVTAEPEPQAADNN